MCAAPAHTFFQGKLRHARPRSHVLQGPCPVQQNKVVGQVCGLGRPKTLLTPQASHTLLEPLVSWGHGSNQLERQGARKSHTFHVLTSLTVIGQH